MSSVLAYIGLGSNLGESAASLQEAWRLLGALEGVETVQLSSAYQSSPVGMESENLFVNAVGCVQTDMPPQELLQELLQVEAQLGRRRIPGAIGYSDRSLDLDLLYYGKECINLPQLQVPHPHRAGRLFVLKPLVEIAPEFHDPLLHCSASHLLENLERELARGNVDPQDIEKIEW